MNLLDVRSRNFRDQKFNSVFIAFSFSSRSLSALCGWTLINRALVSCVLVSITWFCTTLFVVWLHNHYLIKWCDCTIIVCIRAFHHALFSWSISAACSWARIHREYVHCVAVSVSCGAHHDTKQGCFLQCTIRRCESTIIASSMPACRHQSRIHKNNGIMIFRIALSCGATWCDSTLGVTPHSLLYQVVWLHDQNSRSWLHEELSFFVHI